MATWAERNHKLIMSLMVMVIVFFSGMYARDFALSAKIQDNQAAIIANNTETVHLKETVGDHLERIDETIKSFDTKLDTKMEEFTKDIAGIKTYIETTK